MKISIPPLAIVLPVLALALALKGVRYAAPGDADTVETLPRVESFLAQHGWTPAPPTEEPQALPFGGAQFRKAGCATPLRLAFLAGNAETAEFLRQGADEGIAFVQDGKVLSAPSGWRRQRANLLALLRRSAGLSSVPRLPTIAISPRPDPEAESCRGPAQSAWMTLADGE